MEACSLPYVADCIHALLIVESLSTSQSAIGKYHSKIYPATWKSSFLP